MEATARLTESPTKLLLSAVGSPTDVMRKLARLLRTFSAYADSTALDARLHRLRDLGHIERIPTRVQLVVGSIDMLRFWIVPAAKDYYASKGIDFTFHQVLRFADDPASVVDPTGFFTERDVIIGHLMQVVHANPRYDLELLESHEHGLEELEAQVVQMIDGTHPRATSIGAIVEDPEYHARLLEFVRAFRAERGVQAPLRENVASSAHFRNVEQTFGSLPSAMRYFATLPTNLLAAATHVMTVKEFTSDSGARS